MSKKAGSQSNPLLTVIVPCYSMDRLNDVLNLSNSIKTQTYSNIEIIIASDSLSLCEKLALLKSDFPSTRFLYNKVEGVSSARNLGIMNARGEIISFVDDDVILYPDWAMEVVKTFQEDDSVIAVTGPAFPMWEGQPVKWFPDEFSWILGYTAWHDWRESREVENVWGHNMAFRSEIFELCGLFRTRMGPTGNFNQWWRRLGSEENELSLRVREKTGKRIVYNPKIRVKHKVYKYRLALPYIAKRAYHISYSRTTIMMRLYQKHKVLPTEEGILIQRIFLKLFPETFALFLKQPVNAWRKLLVTLVVLIFSSMGYCIARVVSSDVLRDAS